jgi:EPS-associated MarR family transcriptional regulator
MALSVAKPILLMYKCVHWMNRVPVSIDDEVRYRLLRQLAEHPDASQREVARALGISVGKVNYCLRALIQKGWVKIRSFKNSRNKAAYVYIITPKGIEEKINVTGRFLRRKIDEYEHLRHEIKSLSRELSEVRKVDEASRS